MKAPARFYYLLHPQTTLLVTCCDEKGRANIVAVAWHCPVSADPPMACIALRPDRFSHDLIVKNREFVLNTAPAEIARQALFCGRNSGAEVDKFAATRLTPLPARRVRPPVIAECSAFIECRLEQVIPTGDHDLLIGNVLDAYAQDNVLDETGRYNFTEFHPLLHLGGDRFTTAGEVVYDVGDSG